MLPGFRILIALVVLSFAILIFGFGALALLQTAHQNLASQPTWQPAWRTPVEIANAQRNESARETQILALLRVEPPASNTDSSVGSAPPAREAMPAQSSVQETQPDLPRRDATAGATAPPSLGASPAASASGEDGPTAAPPLVEATPGSDDKANNQQAAPAPSADEPAKASASNADTAPDTAAAPSPPTERAAASEPAAIASNTEPAEAATEIVKDDTAAARAEPSMKLASLPDATASSAEARPQVTVSKPDAAELRAKRRARARLRARRLALARARAERLALQQQQQAATNSPFYNSGLSTTQPNTASAMNATPNATPFGPPRGP